MSELLMSCEEALASVAEACSQAVIPPSEEVQLDAGLERVLAVNLVADRDQPPFARSTRDGFAVRSGDLVDQAELQVTGLVRAGEQWQGQALSRGQAIEIMTGAPMPQGTDAVLMVEHADRRGERLQTTRTLHPGENVVAQGAEATQGDTILSAGTRLRAAEIALAASAGAARLQVFRMPVVAILTTGDELVGVGDTPGPQQIRNSNAHGLAALVRTHGGQPQILPIARDTRDALQQALARAASADLLLISGGVSAGKYDLVEPVLLSLGASFRFTGVAMQPGKPTVFGSRPAGPLGRMQWMFGLPGNPISTQVTATLFAMSLMRALGGERSPLPRFVAAELDKPVAAKPGLTRFIPARLDSSLRRVTVRPTGWQGSGDLTANARADCYLVVPQDAPDLPAGSAVRVLLR